MFIADILSVFSLIKEVRFFKSKQNEGLILENCALLQSPVQLEHIQAANGQFCPP